MLNIIGAVNVEKVWVLIYLTSLFQASQLVKGWQTKSTPPRKEIFSWPSGCLAKCYLKDSYLQVCVRQKEISRSWPSSWPVQDMVKKLKTENLSLKIKMRNEQIQQKTTKRMKSWRWQWNATTRAIGLIHDDITSKWNEINDVIVSFLV